MNILWITNILLPEAKKLICKREDFKSSGGWLLGAQKELINDYDVKLTIATVSNLVKELTFLEGSEVNYYVLPLGKGNISYNKDYEQLWKIVESRVHPDVVHIHGTEFTHGLAYIHSCGNKNVVVSIQGLASQIAKYFDAGLDRIEILRNLSLDNIIKKNNIFSQKRMMKERGRWEIEAIRSVNSIIGRTEFDKHHVTIVNPKIHYYHCDETLRPEFYEGCWDKSRSASHVIFVSQSDSSIKGLHIVLKSLAIVRDIVPDVMLRIVGDDFTKGRKVSNYGRMIKNIISNNKLHQNIVFLGKLDAAQMKNEYLNSSVFVCASSIENSSNSVCEAQILGVPCVAAFVGGIPTLIPNEKCGKLYRFEDYEMLAGLILQAFNSAFDNTIMRDLALVRHNPQTNASKLVDIYKTVALQ